MLRFAVFGTVPFLTSILSTMLPMLAAAKQDAMRGVFCYGESGSPRAGRGAAHPFFGLVSPVPFEVGHGAFRLPVEGGTARGRVTAERVPSLSSLSCLLPVSVSLTRPQSRCIRAQRTTVRPHLS